MILSWSRDFKFSVRENCCFKMNYFSWPMLILCWLVVVVWLKVRHKQAWIQSGLFYTIVRNSFHQKNMY